MTQDERRHLRENLKPDSGRYILDGHIPVPCEDLHAWSRWLDTHRTERVVKQEDVGPFWVSTVFMGLDHDFSEKGPPLLFETMLFKSVRTDFTADDAKRALDFLMDAPQLRTSTWELALEQHAEAVAWAKRKLA
jgi:hypothetical protein